MYGRQVNNYLNSSDMFQITHIRPVIRKKSKPDEEEPLHNDILANISVNDEAEDIESYKKAKIAELIAQFGDEIETVDLTIKQTTK